MYSYDCPCKCVDIAVAPSHDPKAIIEFPAMVVVALCGLSGSGKSALAAELVAQRGFQLCAVCGPCDLSSSQDELSPNVDCGSTLCFSSTEEAIDALTPRWRESFVFASLPGRADYDAWLYRPFFIVVALAAPAAVRLVRLRAREPDVDAAEMVRRDDAAMFGPCGLMHVLPHARLTLANSGSLAALRAFAAGLAVDDLAGFANCSIGTHDVSSAFGNDSHSRPHGAALFPIPEYARVNGVDDTVDGHGHGNARHAESDGGKASLALSPLSNSSFVSALPLDDARWTRPTWDAYFMALAELTSRRSNCMKRRVGAILTSADNRVLSTGYNGTARGLPNCSSGGCPRCNANARRGTALDACLCLHAEENALLEAGRAASRGATIYCTLRPCLTCAQKILQCGVARVVYGAEYAAEHNTADLLAIAGVPMEQYAATVPSFVSLDDVSL